MFNTNAEFTKERRRSGFEEYFELLLALGPEYAPFIATFLKGDSSAHENDGFDELGESHYVTDSVAVQSMSASPNNNQPASEVSILRTFSGCAHLCTCADS